MRIKTVISLVVVVLVLSCLIVIEAGWFNEARQPIVSSSALSEKEAAEAAARHLRCQARHWKYVILQQQQ